MLALLTEDLPKEMQEKPRIHRNVIYICMAPTSYALPGTLETRKAVFEPGEHFKMWQISGINLKILALPCHNKQ